MLVRDELPLRTCHRRARAGDQNETHAPSYLKSGQDTSTQARVQGFLVRLGLVHENPEYEGSEEWNYSADSSIWYLEASLNMYFSYYYRYCSGNSVKYHSYIDSVKTPINSGEEGYNILELFNLYELISDSIEELYDGIEGEDKFFLLIDIGEIRDDSIKAYFVCAKAYDVPQHLDPYYWGVDLGKCAGGDVGRDAADNIVDIANDPYPSYPSTTSSCHYFELVQPTSWISPVFANGYLWSDQYFGSSLIPPCLEGYEQYDYAGYLPLLANVYHPGGVVSP